MSNRDICIAELGSMEEAHILNRSFFKDFFRTNCDNEYRYCGSCGYHW